MHFRTLHNFHSRTPIPTLIRAPQSCGLHSRRVKHSSMVWALFSKSEGVTSEKKKNTGGGLFSWAARTSPGCELAPETAPAGQEIATFAGGCFWGLQLAFDRVQGVKHSSVGYIGGHDTEPSYESVCSGRTGHAEAVQVYYDPNEVKYQQLLDCFFAHVDPTTKNRQGGDMGTQYRSAIYYYNEDQKKAAEKRFQEVNDQLSQSLFRRVIGSKVVTELAPGSDYYIAEKYHQKYLQKGGRFGMGQSAEKGCQDKIR